MTQPDETLSEDHPFKRHGDALEEAVVAESPVAKEADESADAEDD